MQFIQLVPWWGWVIVAVIALAVVGSVISIIKKSAEGFKYIILIIFWVLKITFYIIFSPILLIIFIVKKLSGRKKSK